MMKTKPLFVATTLIEVGAALALIVSPAFVASILIGAPFDTAADSIVGRMAGAALLALVLACWLARNDDHTGAATGIISALLLYNVGTGVVFAYAGAGLRLFGIGLWPALVLHGALAVWCLACLLTNRSEARSGNRDEIEKLK